MDSDNNKSEIYLNYKGWLIENRGSIKPEIGDEVFITRLSEGMMVLKVKDIIDDEYIIVSTFGKVRLDCLLVKKIDFKLDWSNSVNLGLIRSVGSFKDIATFVIMRFDDTAVFELHRFANDKVICTGLYSECKEKANEIWLSALYKS